MTRSLTTGPDAQWAAARDGRKVVLLAGGAAPAVGQLELASDDCDIALVGPPTMLAVVSREPSGDDGRRQAYPPAAVAAIVAEGFPDERHDRSRPSQEQREHQHRQRATEPHVQLGVADAGDPGERAGVSLAPGQDPEPGEDRRDRDEVGRRVEPPSPAPVSLEADIVDAVSSHSRRRSSATNSATAWAKTSRCRTSMHRRRSRSR